MTIPMILLKANCLFRRLSDAVVGLTLDARKDVVVITGGSNGLGKELVRVFSTNGLTVINLDVSPCSDPYENVFFVKCDVSDKTQIQQAYNEIQRKFGFVSVLINNAGVMTGKPLTELSNEEIEKVIAVNLLSNFYLDKAFLPAMLDNKRGYIVTIASVLGYMSPAYLSAYGALKSGVIALHESLTYELGPPSLSKSGVKTLLVAPGQLRTAMFSSVQTPSQLLAPQLEPNYVANVIFQAVELGQRGEIKIPLYGKFLPLFRALPWRVTELVRYYSGMDASMKVSAGKREQCDA